MSKDDEHSSLDDLANSLDPLHLDDFFYGNNDGYTTYDEMVTADIIESEEEKFNKRNNTSTYGDEDDEDSDDEDEEYDDDEVDEDDDSQDDTVDCFDEEDEEFSYSSEQVDNYASDKYITRVSPDFLIRDLENEKAMGIEKISFYAYWLPDSVGALIITGELYAKKPLKIPITICIEEYDRDDDLIGIKDCFDYTGSSGIGERAIRPQTFFNRYPFEVELHFDQHKISGNKFKFVIKPDNEDDDLDDVIEKSKGIKTTCTIDIEQELQQLDPTKYIQVANLKEGEKIPKDMIKYYLEDYSGLTDLKSVFVKKHKNDSVYWANQLNYSLMVNGKTDKDSLIYYLFYNDKKELIEYRVERIDGDKKYKDKFYQSFFNFPPCEKICKVIVYAGPHPLNYLGDEFFTGLFR
ncbi:MAG: hypothetical protein IJQ07_00245 [Clostridia bacterium]|nr:hypothetical protein [Clostridia bacterium]